MTTPRTYQQLGLRRVINGAATLTRLGGSLMPPEVLDAMRDAAGSFVIYDDLQRAVGRRLAELTSNEAAYVSSGAAAGLAVATAACVAGTDREKLSRLPDTTGMKNEVIVHRSQRNGYDHAIRQIGVTLVEIGDAESTTAGELEAAITERTAAVFYFAGALAAHSIPLPEVVRSPTRAACRSSSTRRRRSRRSATSGTSRATSAATWRSSPAARACAARNRPAWCSGGPT